MSFKTLHYVLTVPMRNGNFLCQADIWETRRVLTVPMRNGNFYVIATFHIHLYQVLTVPMRNGNFGFMCENPYSTTSSYRTYEEWKLPKQKLCYHFWVPFLPYLWGMETPVFNPLSFISKRSYRTYEEWKLVYSCMETLHRSVLTVPMRNGNSWQYT